jgi:ribosomal protein L40E
VAFLAITVFCRRCFRNAPITASYCDSCGTMLRPPESRRGYYAQQAPLYPTPTSAESDSGTRPQLIKDVIDLLILNWNQLDWKTLGAVLDALSKFYVRGEREVVAARYLRELREWSSASEVFVYGGYYYCKKHRVPLQYVEGRPWCPVEQRYLRTQ